MAVKCLVEPSWALVQPSLGLAETSKILIEVVGVRLSRICTYSLRITRLAKDNGGGKHVRGLVLVNWL
jgi:hypothetical protein